ncbi:DUF1127 domain-containing protein [Methylobacterium sp. sgz302541]|uniref:DUF1127 domain-containing protein n=1 Tax=unclassified Methylobacterium TaxID=2615210 RepID=UPI003D336A52
MSAAVTSRQLDSFFAVSRHAGAKPAPIWQVWARRIRVRRALAALHPEQCREAGLDVHAIRAESLKPFWRA